MFSVFGLAQPPLPLSAARYFLPTATVRRGCRPCASGHLRASHAMRRSALLCGQPGNKLTLIVPATFRAPPRGSLGPQETTKQYYKRKNTKQSLKKKSCQCGARGRGGCPGHRCGAKSRADEAPGLPHGHLSALPARVGHAVATAPLGAPLSTLGEVERPLESAYTRGGARGEAGSRRASRLGGRPLGAQTRRGAGRKRGACAGAGGAGYRGASGAAIR